MTATLLLAAHGTVSEAGSATTRALADAVRAARPGLAVELCFLDVAAPSLRESLDRLAGDVVVVPLLLSAGYHVTMDIPAIVAGRGSVRVTRHLGPDESIIDAVADRLREAGANAAGSTVLAVVSSTRESAQIEIDAARGRLEAKLGRPVGLLPLGRDVSAALDSLPTPVAVAAYLLAEGTFLTSLGQVIGNRGVVAKPIGVHPALVGLVLERFDETLAAD